MRGLVRREVAAALRRVSPVALARTARQRWRGGGPAALAWALRLTGAAVAAYVVALTLLPGQVPLTAPLTALLVVQLTPVRLLAAGADRITAVVAGVLVAVAVAAVLPLSWWSLGLIIAVAILVGQLLRLRDNLIEVAISAMLVLGAGSFGSTATAWDRILETLVGAAVGVGVTLVLPPRIASSAAGSALEEMADRLADLLRGSAQALASEQPVSEAAGDWLGTARHITHDVPRVGAAVLRAEEGRRYNLRALTATDAGPGLREGIESLENTAVTVRSMYRSLLDSSGDRAWRDDDLAVMVRGAAALALEDMAGAVQAFGDLIVVDARHRDRAPARQRLDAAVEDLREARARLTDLVLADDARFSSLNTTLLQAVDRLQVDLDPRHRDSSLAQHPAHGLPAHLERRREGRRADAEARREAGVLDSRDIGPRHSTPRRLAPRPFGLSSHRSDDR